MPSAEDVFRIVDELTLPLVDLVGVYLVASRQLGRCLLLTDCNQCDLGLECCRELSSRFRHRVLLRGWRARLQYYSLAIGPDFGDHFCVHCHRHARVDKSSAVQPIHMDVSRVYAIIHAFFDVVGAAAIDLAPG